MKNQKIILVIAILIIGCFLTSCQGQKANVSVDLGSSSLFTERERKDAVETIQKEFAHLEGCTLHSLTYAGDERSLAEGSEENGLAADYDECAVFHSSFHTPKEPEGAWEADTEYTWDWVLARNDGRNWVIVGYGYG
ncbi:MAG: hypothetical protein IKF39_10430 [Oscillospiraceae bacterium]|nr:hypothetical protein [Oscillospiraceae bacterium]